MFSPRIYVCSPIKLCSFSSKVLEYAQDGVWLVTESYKACNDEEISLKKGQHVEVLVKTHGSSRWRVRVVNNDGTVPAEGWVPYTALRKADDRENRRKRNSDISHSSSEGKLSFVLNITFTKLNNLGAELVRTGKTFKIKVGVTKHLSLLPIWMFW